MMKNEYLSNLAMYEETKEKGLNLTQNKSETTALRLAILIKKIELLDEFVTDLVTEKEAEIEIKDKLFYSLSTDLMKIVEEI